MGRVAPSVIARQQLQELLSGGADRGSNVVSALVETVTRMVVQELLEGEQADYLGGRGRYERRGEGQLGSRNGYAPGRASIPSNRGDFGCSDVERVAGLVVPALGARQAGPARVFLLRGRRGSGVQGAPKARRAQRDAKHPGGPRGDPVSFAGSTRAAAAQPLPFVCFVPRAGGWITGPAGGLGPVRSRPG